MTRHPYRARPGRAHGALALAVGLFVLAAAPVTTLAQPWLTSLTPTRISAGTGSLLTIFGSGIGSLSDVVAFPGPSYVAPSAAGSGWVTVAVPQTYSGAVQVYSASMGMWSANTLDLNISFTWTHTQWSPASFSWWMNQNGAPGNTFDAALIACLSGYNSWQCQSNLSIGYNGTTALLPNDHDDGVNVLGWMTCCWDPGTIAITDWTYWVSTGNIIEADISFNSQHYTWNTNGSASDMDIENIAAHEQGHSIGFGDEYGAADNLDTMYGWSNNGDLVKRNLNIDDVEGAEAIYPHAGRPDLVSVARSGWYAPVVPRPDADATPTSVPLPSAVPGNATCYVSWNVRNAGLDCASPHWHHYLYSDGAWTGWLLSVGGVTNPGFDASALNAAIYVRGGRHTLEVWSDIDQEIVESDESNNTYREQYVWSPYALADQQSLYRDVPPEMGWFAVPNCDGFQVTGNWWSSVAIIPLSAGDDYDLRLFDDYADAVSGFWTPLAYSSSGGQYTDFVLVNGNTAGYGATRQAGVVRYSAGSGASYLIHTSNQVGGTIYPSTTYAAEVTTGEVVMGAYDILKVHEVYLGDTSTVYRFTMDCLLGAADLDFAIYDAHTSHLGKYDYLASSTASGAGADEFFAYQPPVVGYYGVVVFKKNSADVGVAGSYELRVGRALANLHAGTTPAGWSSPVVPRTSPDATEGSATLPATLPGNAFGTWLNFSFEQQGPGTVPPYNTQVYQDEGNFVGMAYFTYPTDPGMYRSLNLNLPIVAGGRHSITEYIDQNAEVAETDEADNVWRGQWVWSPLITARAVPNVRYAPPLYGYFAYPNCDGAAFTREAGYAWVTAIAPYNPGDDYDLYLYDDYTGATAGFSNLLGMSAYGGNSTDFVVGHYSYTPVTVYPGAVRYATDGGGGAFALDQTDAQGRNGYGTGSFPGQTLDANRVVDVYEAYLTAGQSYRFELTRTGGPSLLSFEIFPGTAGVVYGRHQSAAYGDETLPVTYTVPEPDGTGWHPVVVFRSAGTDAASPVTYDLEWGPRAPTGVDDGEPALPTTLAFRGAVPNPTTGQSTFDFSLPAQATVNLEIYDLRGRRVATLFDGELPRGEHRIAWDGRDGAGAGVSSGVYYARLRTQGRVLTQKVNLVR